MYSVMATENDVYIAKNINGIHSVVMRCTNATMTVEERINMATDFVTAVNDAQKGAKGR